jgi:hypothetical protein
LRDLRSQSSLPNQIGDQVLGLTDVSSKICIPASTRLASSDHFAATMRCTAIKPPDATPAARPDRKPSVTATNATGTAYSIE